MALSIQCGNHGNRIAAVVCTHLLHSKDKMGFVENSEDPSDLQAWCLSCEALYLSEGDKTEKFERYNDRAMVCDLCYLEIKSFHK